MKGRSKVDITAKALVYLDVYYDNWEAMLHPIALARYDNNVLAICKPSLAVLLLGTCQSFGFRSFLQAVGTAYSRAKKSMFFNINLTFNINTVPLMSKYSAVHKYMHYRACKPTSTL